MLRVEDIKTFTLDIAGGYFWWQVELKDNIIYQIKYRIEKHITPAGNKSKRKIYYIKKNDKELIFDDEVKKWFKAFRYSYIRCGI